MTVSRRSRSAPNAAANARPRHAAAREPARFPAPTAAPRASSPGAGRRWTFSTTRFCGCEGYGAPRASAWSMRVASWWRCRACSWSRPVPGVRQRVVRCRWPTSRCWRTWRHPRPAAWSTEPPALVWSTAGRPGSPDYWPASPIPSSRMGTHGPDRPRPVGRHRTPVADVARSDGGRVATLGASTPAGCCL